MGVLGNVSFYDPSVKSTARDDACSEGAENRRMCPGVSAPLRRVVLFNAYRQWGMAWL